MREEGREDAHRVAAEHTSWTKPGSVSSAVRVPPPISSAASSTSTDAPPCAKLDRGREPVRPAADDDGVDAVGHSTARGRLPGLPLPELGDLDRRPRRACRAWRRRRASSRSRRTTAAPSTMITRSSPSSKPHCSWTAARSSSSCRCPSPKFQPSTIPRRSRRRPSCSPRVGRRRPSARSSESARPCRCIIRQPTMPAPGRDRRLAVVERSTWSGIQLAVFFSRSSFSWLSPLKSHTPNGQLPA